MDPISYWKYEIIFFYCSKVRRTHTIWAVIIFTAAYSCKPSHRCNWLKVPPLFALIFLSPDVHPRQGGGLQLQPARVLHNWFYVCPWGTNVSTTVLDLLLVLPACFNNSLHGKCLLLSRFFLFLPADSTLNEKRVKASLSLSKCSKSAPRFDAPSVCRNSLSSFASVGAAYKQQQSQHMCFNYIWPIRLSCTLLPLSTLMISIVNANLDKLNFWPVTLLNLGDVNCAAVKAGGLWARAFSRQGVALHCVYTRCLFCLLTASLWLWMNPRFHNTECGLLCGSFASNGCSLYWEEIHGCHAVSTHTQIHSLLPSEHFSPSAVGREPRSWLCAVKCDVHVCVVLSDSKTTSRSSVETMTDLWSWPPCARCAMILHWTITRSLAHFEHF